VLDDATATHTFALLLAVAKRIAEADTFVRAGKWRGWAPIFFIGLDVDHRTLGIAGLGRVGGSSIMTRGATQLSSPKAGLNLSIKRPSCAKPIS